MSFQRIKSYLIPCVLFLLSLFLRLSLISKGPYHLDCLNLAVLAEKTLETHSLQFQFGSGYPLTILLGAFFIFISRIFSQNDPVIAVNLMSVVFSSLSIPAIYFIAHKLFDRTTACLSAIMFSVTPIFLSISVYGKSHTPSIFFLLISIYFLLSSLDTHNRKILLISGIFMGFMGAARLQDAMLMILPMSFLSIFGTDQRTRLSPKEEIVKRLAIFWGIALSVILLFHLPYLMAKHQSSYTQNILTFWQDGMIKNFKGFFSSSLVLSLIFMTLTLTEIGLAAAMIGLVFLAKKSPRIFFFFLLWITVPLLFYGNLYSTVPRFLAFLLPPLIMAQGYVFAKLTKINFTFRLTSLIVYFTIILLLSPFISPLSIRHSHSFLPDYVRWVAGKVEHNAYLITTDDQPFYKYYSGVNTLGRPLSSTPLDNTDLEVFKQTLDNLLANDTPVYITSVGLFTYDADKKFSSFIRNNYALEAVGEEVYEDWHRGILRQFIFYNQLVRIRKKMTVDLTLKQK
jgi:4-amino-4-deoxy-L-arabinose transferase-like glycosyltransferase